MDAAENAQAESYTSFFATAIANYCSGAEGDLELVEGDIVEIANLYREQPGWWKGTVRVGGNETVGMFPCTYVQIGLSQLTQPVKKKKKKRLALATVVADAVTAVKDVR
jgi:hypothetical protein